MSPLIIRPTEPTDLPALLDIYNDEVTQGTATFDLHPKTPAQWQAWFDAHGRDRHPLLTAELNGVAVGYAGLSPYRPQEAFCATVELSVYVAAAVRGRGVGTALMEAILRLARQDAAIHTVVSVITGGNTASIHLHEKYGFISCGTLRETGYKFGRYLDIEHYQLQVDSET